jgi:serralysin
MRLFLTFATLFSVGILSAPQAPEKVAHPLRICSTKEPSQVDEKLHVLESSPSLNKHLDTHTLSTAEIASVRALADSIQQAVGNGLTWTRGSTLKIAFLSGTPALQNRIKVSAMKWTDFINLKLQFVDDPRTAAIRIGIDSNGRSESQVGNLARSVPQDKETMHFGWLTDASSQAELDSVVLHEFGHALGMLHEHQIPSSTILWNKPYVYQYCLTQWKWTRSEVDHNIFEKYTPDQAIFTRMDPYSIMMYSFPPEWSANVPPVSTPWNYQLSPADKQFIALRYPR